MVDFADLVLRTDYSSITKATRAIDDLTAAGQRAEQSTNRLGSASTGASRQVGAWESVQRRATEGVEGHALATGRLTRAFEHLIVSATGVNREIALLATVFGDFAVGGGVVAGVVGGLALIVAAYEKITEATRKAREEHDKYSKALRDENDATRTGPESVRNKQFRAEQETYNGLVARKDLLQTYGARDDDQRIIDLNKKILESWQNLAEYAAHQVATNALPTVSVTSDIHQRTADAERIRLAAERERGAEMAIAADAQNQHRDDINAARRLNLVPQSAVSLIPGVGQLSEVEQKHMESVIKLDEEYKAAAGSFKSVHAALSDFKMGLKEAATGLLERFSPSSLAQGVVGGLASGLIGIVNNVLGSLVSGAISGVRHLLFGSSGAERDAARQAADSAHAMALQIDAVTKALSGDQLGAAINALQIQLISALQAINTALPGTKNEAERNRLRAEAAAQEQQQEARARHQDELNRRYAEEDLQVRNLRALGQGDAADRLAFQEQQQREMQKAIDEGRDATYLNTLATTQNNELLSFLNGTLQDAVRNSPSGFFASAYYSQFASPRSSPSDPFGTGMLPPNYPVEPPGTGSASGSGLRPPGGRSAPITVVVQSVLDGKIVATSVVKAIDQSAAATGGAGSSRSDALNRMPV